MQYCSISGQQVKRGMISTKSGHVFEKELIERQIESLGVCPITQQPLNKNDLVEIKSDIISVPKLDSNLSMNNLLGNIQNEYDQLILENYQLKKSLNNVRQELSQALYQYDAACRVISRLIQDKENSQQKNNQQQNHINNGNSHQQQQQQVNSGLGDLVMDEALRLKDERKKKRKDIEYVQQFRSTEEIQKMECKQEYKFDCEQSSVQINQNDEDLVVCGDKNGLVSIYSIEANKLIGTLENDNQSVNNMKQINMQQNMGIIELVSNGSNRLVYQQFDLQNRQSKLNYQYDHEQSIVDIDIHPSMNRIVSISAADNIKLHDMNRQTNIHGIDYEEMINVSRFNPDGHLLISGFKNDQIRIYSLTDSTVVDSIQVGQTGIQDIAFSNNGYLMASLANNVVDLWDLRKSDKKVNQIQADYLVNSIQFDPSTKLLCLGGEQLGLYDVKTMSPFGNFHENVSEFKFSNFCECLAILDKNVLRIYQ